MTLAISRPGVRSQADVKSCDKALTIKFLLQIGAILMFYNDVDSFFNLSDGALARASSKIVLQKFLSNQKSF